MRSFALIALLGYTLTYVKAQDGEGDDEPAVGMDSDFGEAIAEDAPANFIMDGGAFIDEVAPAEDAPEVPGMDEGEAEAEEEEEEAEGDWGMDEGEAADWGMEEGEAEEEAAPADWDMEEGEDTMDWDEEAEGDWGMEEHEDHEEHDDHEDHHDHEEGESDSDSDDEDEGMNERQIKLLLDFIELYCDYTKDDDHHRHLADHADMMHDWEEAESAMRHGDHDRHERDHDGRDHDGRRDGEGGGMAAAARNWMCDQAVEEFESFYKADERDQKRMAENWSEDLIDEIESIFDGSAAFAAASAAVFVSVSALAF